MYKGASQLIHPHAGGQSHRREGRRGAAAEIWRRLSMGSRRGERGKKFLL